ncbi:cupin domain-containing protein [Pseudopedobacter beijingensis]|uniref:Cupin domain-containing protein n=1 Tax=Pseudopedobacter beijingensis TaxID=1207056 RepID=A0ABW4IJ87_9SPHI
MKKLLIITGILFLGYKLSAQEFDPNKYIIESEKDIGKTQSGPHNGGGESIGYSFFNNVKDFNNVFRKRILKSNSAIGYHTQKEDEVYYVVSGNGQMTLNGKLYNVKSGDAILTRTGSSHGIKNIGKEDLVLIIVYEKMVK